MKRIIIATALALATVGSAFAADAQTYKPNAPKAYVQPVAFDGMYFGVHGGYAFNTEAASPFTGTFGNDNWLAGGSVGFDRRFQNIVIGAELELSATGIDMSTAAGPINVNQSIGAIGSAKLRAGYVLNNTYLLYGFGGIAGAQTETTLSVPGFSRSAETYHVGWTAGAGLEAQLFQNVRLRLEYAYYDFGTTNVGVGVVGPLGVVAPESLTTQAVRVGAIWNF